MVKFGLLGPLFVHDGTAPQPVSGPKVRALLAALLLRPNRVVSRDALKAALWGDDVPASADAALANHLTRLRRGLPALDGVVEERLRTVPPGYQLRVHEGELDIDVFDARMHAARRAHRREDWAAVLRESTAALYLWRGTPLADVHPFAEQDEAALRVHQLCEERLQILEWRFDAELHQGRHQQAVAPLTALVAEHPLREGLHARLMSALRQSGRRADAAAVYHRLRRTLSDELGVEPGADAQRAYAALRTGPRGTATTSTARPTPPFQVPCESTAFVGRDQEREQVTALLGGAGDPPVRLPRAVVVSGMAGVGKTAFAVHVAHRMRDQFPDGILYADLHGYCSARPRPAGEVIARFLSDLGMHPEMVPDDTDDRALLLQEALAGRRVLLLLDNVRDKRQVAPLLPVGGRSVALITSRKLLPGLTDTAAVTLLPLPRSDQRALLSALCGAERLLAEPDAADEIMAACGGLPLALTIVGGRLLSRPQWPLSLLAGRLTPRQGRLEALSMDTADVERAFSMSYVAMRDSALPLERQAARAFRLLGLWAHPVTPKAAAALLDVPVHRAAVLLDLLTDAHLAYSPAPDHYALHDLLGEYAERRVTEEESPQERREAQIRLLSWYAAAVAEACRTATKETQTPPPLDDGRIQETPVFADDEEAIRWSVGELPAIREGIARAGELGRSDMAWRLAAGLFGYATTHGWTGEWDHCLHQAMDIARAHDDTLGQAWLHRRIAVAHGMASRNEACLAHLRIAWDHFSGHGDLRAEASLLGGMSAAHARLGDAEQAFACALRSRELFLELNPEPGDVRIEALSLSRLAVARQLRGEHEQAAEEHRQAADLLRKAGHSILLADSLTRLGDVLALLGRREEAFDALSEALEVRQRMNDYSGTADCLRSMATAHEQFLEWDEARESWEAYLELGRRHHLTRRAEESRTALRRLTEQGH
ncbi:BTAD domain-containing putative transcriptional regulator [Streptomyces sp. VRA16 Mangrove soil]|uniref:AfsR/SARP family transcriptional regulator n=1 Tax=Streptomyces sp. VRA16 Mangrove soil TaxID=2817434 RepID=UPI001A9D41A1|nr:BTAD domain-containing putative transcriptional regulator [Streptomyces sp. VRA16 Mangrove soil]MBO1331378.1 tetratricopeptide repeat protein [Streptomyces sp. VRA16 Mangrove soil]